MSRMNALKSWVAGVFGQRRTKSIRSRSSSRPELESLEVRLTPADNFQWTGLRSAVWSDPRNWNVNNNEAVILPGADDSVFFTNTSNVNARVDANFAGTVGSISLGGYTGIITLQRSLTVGSFGQNSGTIAGNFPITITGMNSVWSGGTLQGNGNPATSTLVIPAFAALEITSNVNLDGRVIQNSGTVSWTVNSTITALNGAAINNLSGGDFRVTNGNNNAPATATLSGNGSFFNYGQVVVDAGVTCDMSVPLTSYAGSYLVNGRLGVNQSATFLGESVNAQQASFNGTGVIDFGAGFQAKDVVTNIDLLQFQGNASLFGSMAVQAGLVKINNGLSVTGGSLDSSIGSNVRWTGGDIVLNGATIGNSGHFYFATSGSMTGSGLFNNAAAVFVDTVASVTVSVDFLNDNSLTLLQGTLILDTNAWVQEATVNFDGGNLQVNGDFINEGRVDLHQNGRIAVDTFSNDDVLSFGNHIGDIANMSTLTIAARPNVAGGNFTQGASGSLSIKLGGVNQYDQLVVNGTATLGGTMQVLVPQVFDAEAQPPQWVFVPVPVNWSWTLITANQIQQQFATVNLPPPLFRFSAPTYGANTFRVQNPDLQVPGGQIAHVNTPLTFLAANGNGISIPIANADDALLQITLSVSHGKLTLGSLSGLTFLTGDGANDTTMTFTGTIADLNAALAGLTYTPDTDYLGNDTLTITTTDTLASGGSYYDFDSIPIWVMEKVTIKPPPP